MEWIKIKRNKYGNAVDAKRIQASLPILVLRRATQVPRSYKVIEKPSEMDYVRFCEVYTHYIPIPKLEV